MVVDRGVQHGCPLRTHLHTCLSTLRRTAVRSFPFVNHEASLANSPASEYSHRLGFAFCFALCPGKYDLLISETLALH